jgi:hypothetical protein
MTTVYFQNPAQRSITNHTVKDRRGKIKYYTQTLLKIQADHYQEET